MKKNSRKRALGKAIPSSYVERPSLLGLSPEPQALFQDVQVILHTAVSNVSPLSFNNDASSNLRTARRIDYVFNANWALILVHAGSSSCHIAGTDSRASRGCSIFARHRPCARHHVDAQPRNSLSERTTGKHHADRTRLKAGKVVVLLRCLGSRRTLFTRGTCPQPITEDRWKDPPRSTSTH